MRDKEELLLILPAITAMDSLIRLFLEQASHPCGSLGGHQMLPRFVLMGKTLSKLRIVQGWNYQQLLLNHGLEAMILAILVIFCRKVQTGVSQLPTDSLPDQPEDYLSMSIQVLALPISVHQMRETR